MYIRPYMLYFGSPSCERCIRYYTQMKKLMNLNSKNFRFINGDDFDNKEIQDLCDEHNVDEYPHVKIYILKKCIYEEIGDLNLQEIERNMDMRIKPENASKYTTG